MPRARRASGIELAGVLECVEVVAAARHAVEPMKICGTVVRLARGVISARKAELPPTSISLKVTRLLRQQFLGPAAIGAVGGGVDFDFGHRDFTSTTSLYGRAARVDNPRKDQHIDLAGAGPQQGAGAGIDGRAGGQDVVDQDDMPACDLGLACGVNPERALHIGGAFGFRQPDLLRGRLARA